MDEIKIAKEKIQEQVESEVIDPEQLSKISNDLIEYIFDVLKHKKTSVIEDLFIVETLRRVITGFSANMIIKITSNIEALDNYKDFLEKDLSSLVETIQEEFKKKMN
jgi:hypothetical protein